MSKVFCIWKGEGGGSLCLGQRVTCCAVWYLWLWHTACHLLPGASLAPTTRPNVGGDGCAADGHKASALPHWPPPVTDRSPDQRQKEEGGRSSRHVTEKVLGKAKSTAEDKPRAVIKDDKCKRSGRRASPPAQQCKEEIARFLASSPPLRRPVGFLGKGEVP